MEIDATEAQDGDSGCDMDGESRSRLRYCSSSPVLVDLRIPTLAQFLVLRGLSLRLANLHLYPFART